MRYSLRTLLILVTVLGVLFARVAYLKQSAISHRQKAAALVLRLVANERFTAAETQNFVLFLASGASRIKPRVLINHEGRAIILESDVGREHLVQFEANTPDWQAAVAHEIIAQRFERATLRPWNLVQDQVEKISD